MLPAAQETSPQIQAAPGMMKTKGAIVEHSPAGFTLRDEWGLELTVAVTGGRLAKPAEPGARARPRPGPGRPRRGVAALRRPR